ncbi:MAG: GMC family oxidoreductase [Thermomicrobiales bacterium]|nr:GMC family oxidoreductase [Thermomicrobiales bacterium]
MGGGTLARALAGSGARVLLLERGEFLPREAENWSPEAVFLRNRYKTTEVWQDADGAPFHPGIHYWVGGKTKLYGAALPRLRREDFGALEHEGGTSPDWPVTYEEFEPYYAIAERWYLVHGDGTEDPTEPPRSGPYPYPAMPHDPYMAELGERFRAQGLHPFSLPVGLDLREGGDCIRCRTCDAFVCQLGAKGDAERCGVRPALEHDNVELVTGTLARRLLTDVTGKTVTGIEVERGGERSIVRAGTYVLSAGAVNSAALLLRSHPDGLANGSGLVGRNYMVHNNAVLVAVHPTRKNPTVFQKSLALNDFYFRGPDFPYPLGNLQPVGKLQAAMLAGAAPHVPKPLLGAVAARSTDWWVMSEDLPDPENRVTLAPDGTIRVTWKANNLVAHRRLMREAKRVMREAGYPVLLDRMMGIETNSHQVGTLRFGDDPATSVLDPVGKAHDLDNLYVVDASFFPSSAAVNPALTIAAQAIRVAERLTGRAVEV